VFQRRLQSLYAIIRLYLIFQFSQAALEAIRVFA
jgi:hypothetical protein